MKKILISVSIIAAVAAIGIGATTAFFSDTETSLGNTFTAGSIDLKVDSTQHYNGNVCEKVSNVYIWTGGNPYPVPDSPCDGTWVATDLGAEKFFNFLDVKPGDSGEDTISLYVDNNPAWACVDVNITNNNEKTCTEPEQAAETADGHPCVADAETGELAQNIYFTAWADYNGDNIWEADEPLLFTNKYGPASDVLGGKTYALADSLHGNVPLPGGSTRWVGLAWCAGTMTVNETDHTISCNGAGMGNEAQSDSMVGTIGFRVEQSRNNPGFICGQY